MTFVKRSGAIALTVWVFVTAQADQVYKCTSATGAISFQQTPCPQDSKQTNVEIRNDTATPAPMSCSTVATPAANPRAGSGTRTGGTEPARPSAFGPPAAPVVPCSDDVTSNYKLPKFPLQNTPPPLPRQQSASAPNANDISYECDAANGEVFYRHDRCPEEVHLRTTSTYDERTGRTIWQDDSAAVSSNQISREEACRKISTAGSIGRDGHKRDQQVATYDKNLGRDPCR